MRERNSQIGLSLLELLVVFVIVSMVSVVLVQGFGFGLAIYERIKTRGDYLGEELLSSHWFRITSNALLPGKNNLTVFVGHSEAFVGVTLNPLIVESGLPVKIRWAAEDGFLVYEEGDSSFEVIKLEEGRFEYQSRQGDWSSEWNSALRNFELPAAIKLVEGESTRFLAATRTHPFPDLLLEESRRER